MAYDYGLCLADQPGLQEFVGRDSVDLLARCIYSEAEGESLDGKRGVAFVCLNRRNYRTTYFNGGKTYENVILDPRDRFDGMTKHGARCPDKNSTAWKESLNIASNMATQPNPIGTCLWFVRKDLWPNKTLPAPGGGELYQFLPGEPFRKVVEKKTIGEHIFFRVEGW